ncbi:MAG: hypothetical protein PVI06_13795, partial [Desulfobacterales bacterium]
LVFLLVGPATNMASLTVLTGILGKRATAIYVGTIALSAVLFGLVVDQVYAFWGISARALIGQASEIIPYWAGLAGALAILLLSAKPVFRTINPPGRAENENDPEVQIATRPESATLSEPADCGPT